MRHILATSVMVVAVGIVAVLARPAAIRTTVVPLTPAAIAAGANWTDQRPFSTIWLDRVILPAEAMAMPGLSRAAIEAPTFGAWVQPPPSQQGVPTQPPPMDKTYPAQGEVKSIPVDISASPRKSTIFAKMQPRDVCQRHGMHKQYTDKFRWRCSR